MIAREIEARGIATICLSSAWSITRSVNPPRAVFLDFPLGHTAGKRDDPALQRKIMIDTLSMLDGIQIPGTLRKLPYQWQSDDAWKDTVMRPQSVGGRGSKVRDDRVARHELPQYQNEADRLAAERLLRTGQCPGCVFLSA
ncbi:MAG: hypothetical protein R3E82_07240 [Pseudomonadales bacterium]